MQIIKELMQEAIEAVATHHGATDEDVMIAYLSGVGTVRDDVNKLYVKTYLLLAA